MSEQNQTPATSPNSETHQQLVDTIEDAAERLPEHIASVDDPVEGITRVNGTEGFVQHSTPYYSESSYTLPDTVIGNVRTKGSVSDPTAAQGSYTFRSREDQGVEGVTAAREVTPRDRITRADSEHHRETGSGVYKHEFGPKSRDKAARLVADLAISQADKKVSPLERV